MLFKSVFGRLQTSDTDVKWLSSSQMSRQHETIYDDSVYRTVLDGLTAS